MFYISTHREKNQGLLVFYWAKLSLGVRYHPNESEWIVPGTINPEVE